MWHWAPYPFVRIALSFIAGILLYTITGEDLSYSVEIFAFFVALFIVVYLVARRVKTPETNAWAGIAGLLCFAAGGLWVTELRTPHLQYGHLSKLQVQPTYYTGVVSDYIVQKAGYQRTVLTIKQVLVQGRWQVIKGKVQITVPHDNTADYMLTYGDKLLVRGAPRIVSAPANPGQFNYKSFLNNKGIYHQHYLQAGHYSKLGNNPPNYLLYLSIKVRRALDAVMRENITTQREYGIASALVLGVKDDLDNAVRDSYAGTGTMHVLAVSGLHVGLLFGLLMLLLQKANLTGRSKLIYALLVLGVLWLYAFVTGLSPSVLRAVTMFSMVTIAMVVERRHNIYNTLAIAATGLLFFNPYYLFDVSFQLSFLALLGIVYLQPKLYSLLEFNGLIPDKIWTLFTVAIAAQVATLPVGIFYFHQFPVYFWLANLVVVPFATIVLYSGMAALVLSWVPLLSGVVFWVHTTFIWLMNEFNLLLMHLPNALISGLHINLLQVFLLYSLMLSLVLFVALKRLSYLIVSVVIVGVLSFQQINSTIVQQQQKVLSVYSLRGSTAIGFINGRKATILTDSTLQHDSQNYSFNIQPHLWSRGVAAPFIVELGNQPESIVAQTKLPDGNVMLVWQGKKMLVLSRPPQVLPSETDFVLLTRNVRLYANALQKLNARTIIFDSSNSPWYVQRVKEQITQKGIAVHDITEAGALVLEL